MAVWHTKRWVGYALVIALAGVTVGFQVGCHHGSNEEHFTNPPILSYQTSTILATKGALYTSVAPDVEAYAYVNGVGTTLTSGFTFSVSPDLPDGLSIGSSTGVISGTPSAVTAAADYVVTASNITSDGGGYGHFTLNLGVQATSPVTLDYAGTGAASVAVGDSLALNLPSNALTGGVATGFGVSPALPDGLDLSLDTGGVSGTASAAMAATTYTLTATTAVGSANAKFVLWITATQPAAPLGLAYADPGTLTVNTAYTGTAPTFSNSPVAVVFTVSSALPTGLTLDPLTGVISGTPTTASAATDYTIKASNGGGASVAVLALTVQ